MHLTSTMQMCDSSPTPLSRMPLSTAEFETVRDVVVRLWITEKRALREVKRIMEEEHGFSAT